MAPSNLELEEQMHEGFTPWVAEHRRGTKGKISDTGYNPLAYPPQRIDVVTSPALINAGTTPENALEELRNRYAQIMGSYAAARFQIDTFRSAKAFEDSSERLVEVVTNYIEDGKSIGLITDHAEGLFDMAKGQGGLSLAIAASHGPAYIGNFNAWVNKLMTRQQLTGQYIPTLLSEGGGIRWVIPDTANGHKYVTNPAIAKIVNSGALKSFAEDKKASKGTVEVIVPTGSRMLTKANDEGAIDYLIAPRLPDSSANLLSHLDGVIAFSSWAARISISKFVEIKFDSKSERVEKSAKVAEDIRELLRQQTQLVSGLPVVYAEELEPSVQN